MAKAVRGKVAATCGIGRGNHPAERARTCRERLRRRKLCKGRASQKSLVSVAAAVEKHLAKRREVRRAREHSGVPSYATHGERVFVVNFSPKQMLAICCVIFRGSNAA